MSIYILKRYLQHSHCAFSDGQSVATRLAKQINRVTQSIKKDVQKYNNDDHGVIPQECLVLYLFLSIQFLDSNVGYLPIGNNLLKPPINRVAKKQIAQERHVSLHMSIFCLIRNYKLK